MSRPKAGRIHLSMFGEVALKMWVDGPPITWKRPQQSAAGHRFTDKAARDQQRLIAHEAARQLEPSRAGMNKDRFAAQFEFCTAYMQSDIDNLVKLAMDALNEVVWADDRSVEWIAAKKIKTAKKDQGTGILVLRIQGDPDQ